MKRLQVLLNDSWEYVFCRNVLKATPIITKNKNNAIYGDNNSKAYFERYFSEYQFRII